MRLWQRRTSDRAQRVECADGSIRYRYSAEHLTLLVPEDGSSFITSQLEHAETRSDGRVDEAPQPVLARFARELAQQAGLARERYRDALLAYNQEPCDPVRVRALDKARRVDTALGDLGVDLLRFGQSLHDGAVSSEQAGRWLLRFPRLLARSDPEHALTVDLQRAAAQMREWQGAEQ
ncbi:MAG TPA: hypothetical protein VFA70_01935 [Dehalococcoidia bacterium]|nr:hypothetical protein [Dehalococcoidia bacterium]